MFAIAAGLGSYVEALSRKSNTEFSVWYLLSSIAFALLPYKLFELFLDTSVWDHQILNSTMRLHFSFFAVEKDLNQWLLTLLGWCLMLVSVWLLFTNINLTQIFCLTGNYFADEWTELFVTFCSLVSCWEDEDEALQRMDYKGQRFLFHVYAGTCCWSLILYSL